jgi:hypothetical protein
MFSSVATVELPVLAEQALKPAAVMASAALCNIRHVMMVPSRTVVAADEREAPEGETGASEERRLVWGLAAFRSNVMGLALLRIDLDQAP